MRILGIDTATSIASIALIENGNLTAEETDPPKNTALAGVAKGANHCETILPLIDTVLNRSGLSLGDLAGLAVSIGPGSFTGLRIGLSTIKGLAYRSGIPLVGVSTLLANAARATEWQGLVCALLDARKNEVYAALFERSGATVNRLTEDVVAPARSVVKMIQSLADSVACLFVGEGAQIYRQLLADALGGQAHLSSADTFPSVAAVVARLSEERFRRNEVDSVDTLVPVYLRSAEAERRLREMP